MPISRAEQEQRTGSNYPGTFIVLENAGAAGNVDQLEFSQLPSIIEAVALGNDTGRIFLPRSDILIADGRNQVFRPIEVVSNESSENLLVCLPLSCIIFS